MANPIPFSETADNTERVWGKEISLLYPTYGRFWSRFIGTRKSEDVLLPYKMKFKNPKTIFYEPNESKSREWLDVAIAHWTIFVRLAGVQYHFRRAVDELALYKNSGSGVDEKRQSLAHFWEEIHCVYTQMDGAFDAASDFATKAMKWIGGFNPHSFAKLEDFLNFKGPRGLSLISDKAVLYNKLSTIRNFGIHVCRLPIFIDEDGDFQVPDILPKDTNVMDVVLGKVKPPLVKVGKKLSEDHQMLFRYCESIGGLIYEDMEALVQGGNIEIDYNSGQSYPILLDLWKQERQGITDEMQAVFLSACNSGVKGSWGNLPSFGTATHHAPYSRFENP